ncbi:MAG: hypothetical protein Q4D38_11075 [Planctomycetia bacterium]|nr:hypothetical protein [Planctomycetia bacterium]
MKKQFGPDSGLAGGKYHLQILVIPIKLEVFATLHDCSAQLRQREAAAFGCKCLLFWTVAVLSKVAAVRNLRGAEDKIRLTDFSMI